MGKHPTRRTPPPFETGEELIQGFVRDSVRWFEQHSIDPSEARVAAAGLLSMLMNERLAPEDITKELITLTYMFTQNTFINRGHEIPLRDQKRFNALVHIMQRMYETDPAAYETVVKFGTKSH